LVRLHALEQRLAEAPVPSDVRTLRTNRLKPLRELREAAIFCHLISERTGTRVLLAHDESDDYDFVAGWQDGDDAHFAPVQIKELVPEALNATATFNQLVAGLAKYVSAPELVVAIHVNRAMHFEPADMKIPELPIAELWAFGAIAPDQSEWALWGNLLLTREGTRHAYPTA
jgi:hypothetical protein